MGPPAGRSRLARPREPLLIVVAFAFAAAGCSVEPPSASDYVARVTAARVAKNAAFKNQPEPVPVGLARVLHDVHALLNEMQPQTPGPNIIQRASAQLFAVHCGALVYQHDLETRSRLTAASILCAE